MTAEPYKSNLKKIGDCKHLLSVEVPGNEVESCFQEAFQRIQKRAKMPGFREGKVPLNLVESVYADKAKDEVVQALVEKAFRACVIKHQVKMIGTPRIRNLEAKRGAKMKFEAEVETSPHFRIRNYKGIHLKRPPVSVGEAEVQRSLDSLRESRAELLPLDPPRPAQAGDVVRCDAEVTSGGKTEVQKGVHITIPESPEARDDFARQVEGANVGDMREVLVKEPSERHYRLTVRDVKFKKMPPLDDALAASFGKKDLNELREAVRENLVRYRDEEIRMKLQDEICQKLLKDNKIAVPAGLVEDQKRHLMEEWQSRGRQDQSSDGTLEAEAQKKAAEQVTLYFVFQKIAEEEKISVQPQELQERIGAIARQTGRSVEDVQTNASQELFRRIKHDKTLQFLLDQAIIKEEAK